MKFDYDCQRRKDNWNIGPVQPIRALTVGVSKLVSLEDEIEQISLFDTEDEKRSRQDKLEQVVDDLRKKHGLDAIRLGSQENMDISPVLRNKLLINLSYWELKKNSPPPS